MSCKVDPEWNLRPVWYIYAVFVEIAERAVLAGTEGANHSVRPLSGLVRCVPSPSPLAQWLFSCCHRVMLHSNTEIQYTDSSRNTR